MYLDAILTLLLKEAMAKKAQEILDKPSIIYKTKKTKTDKKQLSDNHLLMEEYT